MLYDFDVCRTERDGPRNFIEKPRRLEVRHRILKNHRKNEKRQKTEEKRIYENPLVPLGERTIRLESAK